ncbi:Gfo/Idh/MocA family oxidoreductase [Candidatus Poribacteria bacterium]|nr:Gfo/Idh/MocA family oxidoreductase [Candidatus Poribacteria bacterium]
MAAVKIALVGCGSVSQHYLADLRKSPDAQVVAVCDERIERAEGRAREFGVPAVYGSLADLLAAEPFDLLINTTGMQTHYPLNRLALEAGRNVLCEKPIASTLAQGQELLALAKRKGVRIWGAPNAVTSPQFRCLAELLASGEIGKVHAAHACYGHSGPSWGPWFYRKGGGSLYDLGVYSVTTLTGLLGPARAIVALAGTAIPEREIEGERVQVEADDNTMLLIDHGDAVYSHIQTGFVYRRHREDRTIELIGTRGAANLLGWDWAPKGVEVWSDEHPEWQTRCPDAGSYTWQHGASYLAACLVSGSEPLMTGEHAVHVLDVMNSALESAATGRRVEVRSSFRHPLFA